MSRGGVWAVRSLVICALLAPNTVGAQSPEPLVATPRLRIVVPPNVAPMVDVYLDGVALPGLTDFVPAGVSPYTTVSSGSHTVDLFADGADPQLATALASAVVDFGDAGARTFAVRGDSSVMVLDDTTVPPAAGASLRLVDLDTDAGPVDAWVGDRQLAIGLSPVFPSSRFLLDAGTQSLTTNAPGDRQSLVASEDITLPDGIRDHRVHGPDLGACRVVPGR